MIVDVIEVNEETGEWRVIWTGDEKDVPPHLRRKLIMPHGFPPLIPKKEELIKIATLEEITRSD